MATNPRIDDLRKRLEKEPSSRLFAQLAEELRKDGEFEEAIRILRAGLARHPAYPSARMTLGRALFDTGDMAAARQELQSVLDGAPDNILASRLLAECLEALGDLEGALQRYRATLALSPGDKGLTARVRDLEGKLQSAARPAPASGAAPAGTPAAAEPAPIPLAEVNEPMELEISHERTAPREEPAAVPVAETPSEFELENAYDSPATQWKPGAAAPPPAAAAPPIDAAAEPSLDTARTSPVLEPVAPPMAAPLERVAPPAYTVTETPFGERTLADEPASTFVVERGPFELAPPVPASTPEPVAPAEPTPSAPPIVEVLPAAPPAAALTPALEPAVAPPPPAPVPSPSVSATPSPASPSAAADDADLVSPTLAELYFNQGFPEKAVEVYRRLLERDPGNARARARVAELGEAASAPRPAPAEAPRAEPPAAGAPDEGERARAARRQALERTIERLESLRAALQKGAR